MAAEAEAGSSSKVVSVSTAIVLNNGKSTVEEYDGEEISYANVNSKNSRNRFASKEKGHVGGTGNRSIKHRDSLVVARTKNDSLNVHVPAEAIAEQGGGVLEKGGSGKDVQTGEQGHHVSSDDNGDYISDTGGGGGSGEGGDTLDPIDILFSYIPYYSLGDPAHDAIVRSTLSGLTPEEIDRRDDYGNTLLILSCQYKHENLGEW